MRAVIQRVTRASVSVEGKPVSAIGQGLLVFLGIEHSDNKDDADWLVKKILECRVFNDHQGKTNLSLADVGAEVLLISQFTLHASTKKGNRPSFIRSAGPEHSLPLYEYAVTLARSILGQKIKTGIFGADMSVELVNEGPFTIIIDSRNRE
jgi:D-tyrosyl-tRNA(Tyr) deacylase